MFGFLFGFLFNYIIFSTIIYGLNNFEFLSTLNNFLLENSYIMKEIESFNNNLLNYIFLKDEIGTT